ncbi:MAG TPA: YceI family protein [Puia sp.]|nr:YceI family protein [Puia sp.]
MIKFFWGTLLILFGTNTIQAQQYKPTDQGSAIAFEIKNFGFNTKGSFSGLDGTITWNASDPGKSAFDVSIGAATISTDNDMRDDHLRKDAYFDVANYPRIRMVSTGVTGPNRSGHYTFHGKLTIKSTTRDLEFPFIATPMGDDYIFKGEFSINREDFGVGGSSTISNDLKVSVTVLAKKQ